jgi:NAD(P)-dependent dehydrogenase (short-subunit alcohol dehydrogenase family)
MSESLEGKAAIVTGAGSGIGEALSRELARRGAHVVVADIDGKNAARVATAIAGAGGRATAAAIDVASESDVRRMVEDTVAAHGRLDYLFNNAGFGIGADARDLTMELWRQVLDVDLFGVLHGMVAAYPIMARQGFGHIVNTSSAAAFFPDPLNAPYAAAKHALIGLSLSYRLEGADLGVKVSCVCPGFVRTNVYQNARMINFDLPADVPLEKVAGAPDKMMDPARAARVILAGVDRNRALIVFPAVIRFARLVYSFCPGPLDRLAARSMHNLRQYRIEPSTPS